MRITRVRISDLYSKLDFTQNPDDANRITLEIAKLESQVEVLKDRLENLKTKLGSTLSVEVQ